jgi:hypothetical protein
MPEMLRFCGRRMTVSKVAHKLCDTISHTGMRKMNDAVHLVDARCDGSSHGGCQTGCVLYWKSSWIKRVDNLNLPGSNDRPDQGTSGLISLPLLQITTRKDPDVDGVEIFSCQATELLRAAPERFPLLEIKQFVLDVATGNTSLIAAIRGFFIGFFNRLQDWSTRVLPPRLRLRGGKPWGFLSGMLDGRTPTSELNLQPGDLVRVRSRDEILATLGKDMRNRGMAFDMEMARYCGRQARVVRRVDRIIDEGTGRMLNLKNSCIVLEGVICSGTYNLNCPRAFYPFWREVWLKRVT